MKKIKLSQNKYALVDDQDYPWLNQWKWSFDGSYAQRIGEGKHIRMHTLILDTPSNMQGDHINGDRLDNRRHNLRNVTHLKNLYNRFSEKNSSSGFKGVHWHKASDKWKVEIGFENKNRYIGIFEDERHAAMAYDIWAKDLHGDYAKLNFNAI